ncbi:MAG: hypothetical protein ISQ14_12470 [Verrucomicrobiae bacterium]|jgi:hypothetical protein|nr:hypothetical protein [Verrucomicrobiae bacterium]
MIAKRVITNRFTDFHLLNVAKTTSQPDARGPYMVIQTGSSPDDPEMRECSFALTRRGTWLHGYIFFMLPKSVRREIAVHETVADVMRIAEELMGKPVVESLDSLRDLLHGTGFSPSAEDSESEVLLEELKRRHPHEIQP